MSVRDTLVNIIIKAKDLGTKPVKGFARALDSLDNTVTRVATGLAAFFGIKAAVSFFKDAVTGAASFEAQMSKVEAVSGATAEEMALLTAEAKRLGSETAFTSAQAGEGLEVLARAGLTATEQIAALGPVLNVAQAEQIGLAEAAGYVTDTLSIYGLEAAEAANVSDLFAKGASIANTSISDLGQALRESGGLAKGSNITLEQTVAILDQLANNGLRGSKAGTALKGILAQLADPASKARTELKKLGINTGDLSTVIAGLEKAGKSGNAAMLAFGTEALPAIKALTNGGSVAMAGFIDKLNEAEGAAAKMAKVANDNLEGAFISLNSAWTSFKDSLAADTLPVFTEQIRSLTTYIRELASGEDVKTLSTSFASMFKDAGARLKEYMAEFDFKAAIASVSEFTTSATSKFETAAHTFGIFSNAIAIASNSVAAGVKTVGGAISFLLADLTGGISNFLNLIGAGDMAAKAKAMADGFTDAANGFKDAILEDSKDITRNWEEMQAHQTAITELQSQARSRALEAEAEAGKTAALVMGEGMLDGTETATGGVEALTKKIEKLADAGTATGSVLAETFRSLTLASTKSEVDAVKESLDAMLSDSLINQFQYNTLLADTEKKLAAISVQAQKTGQEQAEASKQAGQAQTQAATASKQASAGARSAAQALNRIFLAARDSAYELSKATGDLFASLRGISTEGPVGELGKLDASISKARLNLSRLQKTSIDGFSGVIGAAKKMYIASESARLSFFNQTREATQLALALEGVETANAGVVNQARNAAKNLNLLDSVTLSRLTSSIAAAESRLKGMSDNASDAVASLRSELDQINEDYEAIEQREYGVQRAELQTLIAEAGSAGNEKARQDAIEAISLLDQIHSKKIAGIKAEAEERKRYEAEAQRQAAESTRQPKSDSGSSASSGSEKTYTVNLSTGSGSDVSASFGSESEVERFLKLLKEAGLSSL